MKAIVQDRYGEAGVLEFADIPTPTAGEGELLVQVRAAGVEQGVWHFMAGRPYLVRLGIGFKGPKDRVRGREVAGVVEAVGPNVAGFQPGDEIYGTCEGSFAEYVTVKAKLAARKPANLTFEQAAVVPISGGTALQATRGIQPGQRVLVIGASGGVGTFAVQLAKAAGARVTGVCRTESVDHVRAIGADEVVDYTREDFTGPYDLIIDTGGNRTLGRLRKALAPKGILVIVGAETGAKWTGGIGKAMLRAPLLSLFVGQQLRGMLSTEKAEDLDELRELIEAGKVTPVIDRTYPLTEAADAIRHMRTGHPRGKVVVTI
ncbi:NAD(P)-dependent alcohol dehydrogenase [Tenggerimyces flavus]|uniref:NAD(P)-dependent alcohol dehydrogenase n=1 Tax=Tenggerimyces flavus TaxID=1708749 RepID=A0ABV7YGX8_9ACTN|nr:NAD(P)-dependent alcohol dehydrogenase [Tenggerimyces flavus]MBM7790959.1 NADPH:quinone reductase-like Zn-dependent oxidoreductase [Tenggerimyces flavus]